MRPHIDALGYLHLLWGGLGVLLGTAMGVLAFGTHLALEGGRGGPELASVGFLALVALLLVSGGAVQIVAGSGLLKRRSPGRSTALVFAVPNLLLPPFGTALGIYALWVLLNDDARREFGVAASHQVGHT